MKKIMMFCVLILCTVLVVACSKTEKNDQEGNSEDTKKTAAQGQEQSNDSKKTEDQESNQDKQENEDGEEEEKDPKYEVSDDWSVDPIDEDANEQVVLLTFDDAPDEHALEIAKTLKDMNANAIFFVNGNFLESDEKKEELKEIYDMGFMIGNHTYDHEHLPDLSEKEQKEEIVQVNDMVEDVIGEKPKFFRAPNGANTDYSEKVVDDEKMLLMNWSYGYDWNEEYQDKDAITDIMINTDLLANGSNLLMHDREWTAAAIEDIVDGLRDKGYETVDPKQIKTK